MADCVKEGDTVSLDITHGLRHLPMLVVLSAMYLKVVKQVEIAGIYYGAMEMRHLNKNQIAPALNLEGLLRIADWVGALNSFEKDGDYAVFANLLEVDGLATNQTKPLKQAAFFERIFNVPQAAENLKSFIKKCPNSYPALDSCLVKRYMNTLAGIKRVICMNVNVNWLILFFLGKKDSDKENYPDYPRAAIFAVEAFITRLCVYYPRS